MSYHSAEKAKTDNMAKMGNELGSIYSELWQDVAHLESKWQQYVELFGTKPERIELLNEAASFFFYILDGVLWENIVLHLARLTDPSTSFGHANLSIQALPSLIGDDAFRQTITDKIQLAINATAFARDWR